jgi:hypothetical protein
MKALHKKIIGGIMLALCLGPLPLHALETGAQPESAQPPIRPTQSEAWPETWFQSAEWPSAAWSKWLGLGVFTGFIGLMRVRGRSRRRQVEPGTAAIGATDSLPGESTTGKQIADLPDSLNAPVAARELSAEAVPQVSANSAPPKLGDDIESVQKAQFWLALRKPEEAIAILEPLCATNRCPRGWFLLLELYVVSGRRTEYEAAMPRFRARFNAKVPSWDDAVGGAKRRNLGDAPELVERIDQALAKAGNVKAWLRTLLTDNRNGTRQGFEWGIYQDLLLLFEVVCEGWTISRCEQLQQIKLGRFVVDG